MGWGPREVQSAMSAFNVSFQTSLAVAQPVASGPPEPPAGLKDHLGVLIDQAGRQRMLSHRAVMFLALAHGPEAEMARGAARAAAQAFAAIAERFLGRGGAGDLPEAAADWLARLIEARAPGYAPAVGRFMRGFEGQNGVILGGAPDPRELQRLADFVAEDLLKVLNEVVAVLNRELAAIAERERQQAVSAGQTAAQLLEEIQEIGARVRMISINALIQATRAGEAGAGFAVIANEIKDLAGRMQSATQRIMRDLGAALAR